MDNNNRSLLVEPNANKNLAAAGPIREDLIMDEF
jgi:hypothetical protein